VDAEELVLVLEMTEEDKTVEEENDDVEEARPDNVVAASRKSADGCVVCEGGDEDEKDAPLVEEETSKVEGVEVDVDAAATDMDPRDEDKDAVANAVDDAANAGLNALLTPTLDDDDPKCLKLTGETAKEESTPLKDRGMIGEDVPVDENREVDSEDRMLG